METTVGNSVSRVPWNKDKLTGQKPPLKFKEIWAIRIRLQLGAKTRDLAMFNLAIDSKLPLRWRNKPRCDHQLAGRHSVAVRSFSNIRKAFARRLGYEKSESRGHAV